jgi:hypothetical protein
MTRKNLRTAFHALHAGLLALTAAALAATCATPAHAQTYVRPSKGAAIAVISAKTVGIGKNCTVVAPCVSALYDFSSFDAVQLVVTDAASGTVVEGPWVVGNLPGYVQFVLSGASGYGVSAAAKVYGAAAKTSTAALLTSANSTYALSNVTNSTPAVTLVATPMAFSQALTVSGAHDEGAPISPSDKKPLLVGGVTKAAFAADLPELFATAGVNGYGNALNVQLVGSGAMGTIGYTLPVSSTYNHAAGSAAAVTPKTIGGVCLGTCAPTFTASASQRNLRLQVVSTSAGVWCAFDNAPTSTHYQFALKRASSATAYDGGVQVLEWLSDGTSVYCKADDLSGASVALMPY